MLSLLSAPFRFLADHPKWLLVPLVLFGLSAASMTPYAGDRILPDLMFGFTPDTIRQLQEEWQENDGCVDYVKHATVDLIPYMESYTLVLGTLLVWVCRRHSLSAHLASLVWIVMLFDMGETLILRQSCLSPVSEKWIRVASFCNQTKWVTGVTTCVVIVIAFKLPRRRKTRTA